MALMPQNSGSGGNGSFPSLQTVVTALQNAVQAVNGIAKKVSFTFANLKAGTILGNPSATTGSLKQITLGSTLQFSGNVLETDALTGDVTSSANSFATTIANNAVTLAKLAQLPADTLIGNNTGSTADAAALTVSQVNTMLGTGSLVSIANNTVLGNNSGSTASPSALSASQVLAMISQTQGSILYYDGTNWVGLTPGPSGYFLQTEGPAANPQWAPVVVPWTLVKRTTDQTYTSATLTSDSQLQFSMAANTNYKIRCHIKVYQNNSGFITAATSGPASPTKVAMESALVVSSSSTSSASLAPIAAQNVTNGSGYGNFINSLGMAWPHSCIVQETYVSNGANAGTFALQFAFSASSGFTVEAGSYLEYATF